MYPDVQVVPAPPSGGPAIPGPAPEESGSWLPLLLAIMAVGILLALAKKDDKKRDGDMSEWAELLGDGE